MLQFLNFALTMLATYCFGLHSLLVVRYFGLLQLVSWCVLYGAWDYSSRWFWKRERRTEGHWIPVAPPPPHLAFQSFKDKLPRHRVIVAESENDITSEELCVQTCTNELTIFWKIDASIKIIWVSEENQKLVWLIPDTLPEKKFQFLTVLYFACELVKQKKNQYSTK